MKRAGSLRRITPLMPRQVVRRARSFTGPNSTTRALVTKRDLACCLVCGGPGQEQHHRQPRGAGGSSDPAINQPPNLILLCSRHHRDVESWRTNAERYGYLVRRPKSPADVPVMVFGQGWMRLLANGKREPVHHDGD